MRLRVSVTGVYSVENFHRSTIKIWRKCMSKRQFVHKSSTTSDGSSTKDRTAVKFFQNVDKFWQSSVANSGCVNRHIFYTKTVGNYTSHITKMYFLNFCVRKHNFKGKYFQYNTRNNFFFLKHSNESWKKTGTMAVPRLSKTYRLLKAQVTEYTLITETYNLI
jgi:hypothetical protein